LVKPSLLAIVASPHPARDERYLSYGIDAF
jgi:hypothetical protein